MTKAVFYHAGCEVCVDAEKMILDYFDRSKVDLEVVHFGEDPSRIREAEAAGVKSVPALVVNGQTYHINYGASMEDVKNG
ncbi:thioredoxin family protein [Compostibacillus humi]|uniref:Thioredoxin family protein n=1 Tax=Compostibacillus humi TaxID=1245525 RepID=A0A8J2ZPY6_9BACI|nr:thioredoxin family protein [Compostibacillus humi]GGH70773.1 thioredoxin family protein [Compostibacillus humi]HLT56950.1 thioredoxin family protein [Bacillota bacterium]